jgi:hypothetical protein
MFLSFLSLVITPSLMSCTFPVKNDIRDTSDNFEELTDIEVVDIPGCDSGNLYYGIETRDRDGNIITAAETSGYVELWATIGNACKKTIEYQTETQCVIEDWSISGGPSLLSESYSLLCEGGPEERSLPSGKQLQMMISPLNDLVEGTYDISATFSVTNSEIEMITADAALQIIAN